MRIVFPDGAACILDPDEVAPLRTIGEVVVHPHIPATREELIARLREADAVILDYSRMDDDIFAACPGVRHVAFLRIGYRAHVDAEAAARRGITVSNTPDYGATVAEHAVGLLFTPARQIPAAQASLCNPDRPPGWPTRSSRGPLRGRSRSSFPTESSSSST